MVRRLTARRLAVRRIALVIAYGPEVRAFLQSGLAERLAEEREVVLVTSEPSSAAFAGVAFPVLPAPAMEEAAAMLRLRAWGRGLRRRLPALRSASFAAERAAARWLGGGAWPRFLDEHSIDAVVAASAAGGRTLPALQAAANLGRPSVVLLNSWKDLAKRAELPAAVSAIGVVTPHELAQLPPTPAQTASCGSLHQSAVRRAPGMSRRDFCEALGLSPERPIVCYAAALKDSAERDRLSWIVRGLGGLPRRPQLLVRANPMDADLGRYADLDGVAVLRPRWEWRPERDWNCPLPEDLPWWRATLEHCDAAITLPSTVTLDFAAWGKPVLNIAWGLGSAAWRAPAHAAVRRAPGALAVSSPARLLVLLEDALRDPPSLPDADEDAVEAAAQLVRRAIGAEVEAPLRQSAPLEATP